MTNKARRLRREMTRQERRLWYDYLRSYPAHFYRQRAFGNYIVDFYCARAGLVIELDGSGHYKADAKEYDAARTEYLSSFGLSVLRISNHDIDANFEGACMYIDRTVKSLIAVKDLG